MICDTGKNVDLIELQYLLDVLKIQEVVFYRVIFPELYAILALLVVILIGGTLPV